MTTTQELYQATIIHWPTAERLRLAAMILQDLTASGSSSSEAENSTSEQWAVRPVAGNTHTEFVMSSQRQRGAAMEAALTMLAARNSLADIADPVAWQREQRQDRNLPDRTANNQ